MSKKQTFPIEAHITSEEHVQSFAEANIGREMTRRELKLFTSAFIDDGETTDLRDQTLHSAILYATDKEERKRRWERDCEVDRHNAEKWKKWERDHKKLST